MSLNDVIVERISDCLNCPVWKNSLLCDLNNVDLNLLHQNKFSVSYKSGEIICKEGINTLDLICLKRGKVKIVKKGFNETEQIVALKKAGDFIGFPTLMSGSISLSSAVALKNSTVCIIKKKDFFKVVSTNKKIALKIIQLLASDLLNAEQRQVNLTQKHVRSRLAETLLLINNIYGTRSSDGALKGSLKRSDLAGISNMTTANVIRVLSAFSKEKLIEVNYRKIKIIDIDKLKKISISGQ